MMRPIAYLATFFLLTIYLAPGARAQIAGGLETNDQFGGAVATGDFNNDGVEDLAVGVPEEDGVGAVHVIYGSDGVGLANQRNQYFEGLGAAGAQTGRALASGDFNNDGFDDLAIGSPGDLNADGTSRGGRVRFAFGSASGLAIRSAIFVNQNEARFAFALASGDFNGDGFDDVAVGSPGNGVGSADNSGRVFVYFGQDAESLPIDGSRTFRQGSDGLPGSNEAGDQFGFSLAAGNFDFGNADELVIGVPFEDIGSVQDAGAVMVLTNDGTGTLNGAFFIDQDTPDIPGIVEAGDLFGHALATGSFNGNPNINGLAIGAPGEDIGTVQNSGNVTQINGSNGGLLLSTARAFSLDDFPGGADVNGQFGFALASGDFNGDGRDDLAVGAPGVDFFVGTTDAGVVYTLEGTSGGLGTTVGISLAANFDSLPGTPDANGRFGSALASGDFDGDGRDDIAIGEPGGRVGGQNGAGEVIIADNATYPSSPRQGIRVFQGASLPGSVNTETGTTPDALALSTAYPNPFATQTTLTYTLPTAQEARLVAYDLLGREVAVLADGLQPAGTHKATLDAAGLPSGVYMVRLATEAGARTQRVVVAR
ncbi:MAG: T9SS type A sorting domain-containing protein [Bacteroidota bacterium]